MSQSHSKFKVFIGPEALERAASFVKDSSVAPKSLGVEFVESAGTIVLTLGFRDDQPRYDIGLSRVSLGQLALDEAKIAAALEAAASGLDDVICHEFYVDGNGEFFAVFMTQK